MRRSKTDAHWRLITEMQELTGEETLIGLMNELQNLGLVSDEAVEITDVASVDLVRARNVLLERKAAA